MIRQFFILCLMASVAAAAPVANVHVSGERRLSFNDDWRFLKEDAQGAGQIAFNDSAWRALRVPHDWAIEGPFDPKFNPRMGALPSFGVAWYRKHFQLSGNTKDRTFAVEFDGVMSNSQVWINGHELGGRPYGYIGFSFDLTPYLRPAGEENVLAVRVAPEELSSRWYPGAGIYRNVWLDVTGPVHVARWGTTITTPEISGDKAVVVVKTHIENRDASPTSILLETTILTADGRKVAQHGMEHMAPAGGTDEIEQRLIVTAPQLWDVDHPFLYQAVSVIKQGDRVLDRYVTPFGIRSIAFTRAQGFMLNGRHLKLQGVCLHHDLGALGAAVNRRATERQLEMMKSMGVNAIRTSHNPPSPEQLELCDKLGLMVMDEAFDMWQIPKVPNGYAKYFDEWSERDLRDQIRRDRNHPSVIMWSIGNEIAEMNRPDGWKQAKRLTAFCHQEDPTRPTTAAFSEPIGAIKNGLAAEVDIPGINYAPFIYEQVMKDHPDWIIVGTETSSCVSSRGVYHLPLENYIKHPSLQLTSYDVVAPGVKYDYLPDVEFYYQDKLPNVLGEFVWTGVDYLGEPTPYFWSKLSSEKDWPSRSSYYGPVDLAGFPKDRYYLYKSHWDPAPMVHVLPHWNWSGHEGQAIPVMAYTSGDAVELFLNGKSLGWKRRGIDLTELPVSERSSKDGKFMSPYRLMWQVPYAPGTLRAVAYKNGVQIAVDEVRTAGAPARVVLQPDRSQIAADGDDLAFITVRIEDKDGNLCPMADNLVRFKVDGAGRVAAVDNGNSATAEPFQADYRKAFSGMALLIVRSESGKPGNIHVLAASDGMASGETNVLASTRNLDSDGAPR